MPTALVVGLGLIGGAVGMALRQRGWRVHYRDPLHSVDDARNSGAADDVERGDEQLIVVATPVRDAVIEVAREHSAVVTSVCSVMRPLRQAARGRFVAGHPMAGWHEGGLANAHHVQLADAPWFLDAEEPLVEQLVHDCGARPVRVEAAEHDAAVALTSHLPQVLSTALFAYLDPDLAKKFAGGGLRSFRLAASDGGMWASVLEANRDNLRPHADQIAELVRAIIEGRDDDAFARARTLWRALTE